ncbi:response regulator [Sphingobacterium haloxyli]|uniref:Response regulator n=1 Tax=Sphingobacterium haloxyli TaxID=2100533 RepID=A0A2S9J0U3_9SPHI|nr:response regulator [Sphingobacterium haloxyli]PRD46391.1 response regulator [Sphingobacterium haloxyli]
MKNKTILVFDDDTNILDVFTIVLESSGYQVEISETSHNILERVKEVSPDMIIMDNWIPNIGGVKATQILKSDPAFKHIPVIYCSANNDVSSLAEQAGAEAYLAKPFDLDELENTVAGLLQNKAR